jgi:2-oxoglutarate/2-oxoacid ferredoxin oxidoreductase subunit beta
LTVIVFNNQIYGMTGGQVSPTTPVAARAATAPAGNRERPFDICRLALGAGARFVARGTAYHIPDLERLFYATLRHPGFALVEVLVPCPEQYGRYNRSGPASEMLLALKNRAVRVQSALGKSAADLDGKILIGELVYLEPGEAQAR